MNPDVLHRHLNLPLVSPSGQNSQFWKNIKTYQNLLFIHLLGVFCSQEACRKPQQVCGHNGETYNTVCDAFSDRVAVDYEGLCHAVGAVSDVAPDSACSVIPCPPLSSPGCQPVTPPGKDTGDRKSPF